MSVRTGHRPQATDHELKENIVLLHGVFKDDFYRKLKAQRGQNIFVLEARPNLNGAKVTCKALLKHKIKPTLIADNMAGFLFFKSLVKEVVVAYQLNDSNGALVPIGSLILGVLAKKHKTPVKLYPSASKSKMMGSSKEMFSFNGRKVVSAKIDGYVPLVEWLPRKYISKIW